MKSTEQNITGVYLIENFTSIDERGVFVKTFHLPDFFEMGFKDTFAHEKLVYVTQGEIMDVIVDLRVHSATYGQFLTIRIKELGNSVLIPKGCAHGFLTLSDQATVVYNVTTEYDKSADEGILWNSFGLDWGIVSPVISARDQSFKPITDFISPFD